MAMVTTANSANADTILDAAKRALNVFAERSRQACFIDWCVGCVLLYVFSGYAPDGLMAYLGTHLIGLAPLVAVLALTRGGHMIETYCRYKYGGQNGA
jgi:hypothetical protein